MSCWRTLVKLYFNPPNVKGWDGGRAWINSSTLVGRTNLVSQLMRDAIRVGKDGSIEEFWREQRVRNPRELVAWIERICWQCHSVSRAASGWNRGMQAAGGIERSQDCFERWSPRYRRCNSVEVCRQVETKKGALSK